jgi:hypothetical protein
LGVNARGVTKGISIWLSGDSALSFSGERKRNLFGADAGLAKSEISHPARETLVRPTRMPEGLTSISMLADCAASEW